MLVLLFGKPGCGKNFIGKIIEAEYKFLFFDGDNCLTAEMKKRVKTGKVITKKMRQKFYEQLFKKINQLHEIKNNVVVAQSFPIEKYRQLFLKKFPNAKVIMITAEETVVLKRLSKRKHLADENYCKKIHKLFEETKIKYQTIANNMHGEQKIKSQLEKIFTKQNLKQKSSTT
jgi:gluconate kinase